MCRVLSYLGIPILIEDLLYKPSNSFIKQSYHPIYMPHLLNLAGFGLVAWDTVSQHPDLPYIYKTADLPFYDPNLTNLTKKIKPYCLLTHIRGVAYSDENIVSKQNVHPFLFPGAHIALAHNGSLFDFDLMKFDLLQFIKPENRVMIQGTTDSEWIYAIFLSQLENKDSNSITDVMEAIVNTLRILKDVRYKHNIRVNSPVNLFLTNGNFIAATRFVFDYGWQPLNPKTSDFSHLAYHSLWYTYGKKYVLENDEYMMIDNEEKSSMIIASEPLTEDTTTWIEVPEYTMVFATLENEVIQITSHDINL